MGYIDLFDNDDRILFENRNTDWERLMNMTDEEAYVNAKSYPDNLPIEDMKNVTVVCMRQIPGGTILEKYRNLRKNKHKLLVSIRYDADVLAYSKLKGKGYQPIMNDALRAFMEAEIAQKA